MRALTYPRDGVSCKKQRPYRALNGCWTAYFGVELASGVNAALIRAQRQTIDAAFKEALPADLGETGHAAVVGSQADLRQTIAGREPNIEEAA